MSDWTVPFFSQEWIDGSSLAGKVVKQICIEFTQEFENQIQREKENQIREEENQIREKKENQREEENERKEESGLEAAKVNIVQLIAMDFHEKGKEKKLATSGSATSENFSPVSYREVVSEKRGERGGERVMCNGGSVSTKG